MDRKFWAILYSNIIISSNSLCHRHFIIFSVNLFQMKMPLPDAVTLHFYLRRWVMFSQYLCSRRLCVWLVAELKQCDSHSEKQAAYQNVEDAGHVAKWQLISRGVLWITHTYSPYPSYLYPVCRHHVVDNYNDNELFRSVYNTNFLFWFSQHVSVRHFILVFTACFGQIFYLVFTACFGQTFYFGFHMFRSDILFWFSQHVSVRHDM
jgi:hypothetical protein